MAAGIKTKVAARTGDRARRNRRVSIEGQRPGTEYFRAAEGAALAVGAIQPERDDLANKQVSLLLGRQCLNAGSPPVVRGGHCSYERPADSVRWIEASSPCVHPYAHGAPGQ